MALLSHGVSGMDDLDLDIKRTIDDHLDDAELLPFCYLNVRDF